MLSLWANWLQLNSQLNSTGVSFWLYRTYAPRQGILLTVVSLDAGVVNGYRQESIPCLPCAPKLQVAGHSRGNNNELFVKRLENYLIIIKRYINQFFSFFLLLLLLLSSKGYVPYHKDGLGSCARY